MNKSIAEIAAKCGVSAMTVSRALRNNTSVKESTRKLVLEVAEELGYRHAIKAGRPPAENGGGQARASVDLVLGASERNVALFYSELVMSIEKELAKRGYDCVVRTCDGSYQAFVELRDRLRNSTAAGTIITGSFSNEELKALSGVVARSIVIDNPGDASTSSVSFDNIEAGRLGTSRLLETGRKRILLLKGTPDHYFSKDVELGYRAALADAGVDFDASLVLAADFTADGACEVLSAAMAEGLKFDAVFTNDEMACGVYRALSRSKLRIPEAVAVCGCDGLPVGAQLTPALTTVCLDCAEMGCVAVDRVLAADWTRKPCRMKLLPELLVRESA